MADAGWLEHGVDTDGKPYVSFPNWDRWLGESAKKRISASRRKQKERVTQMSQKVVTANKQKDHVPAAVRREVYERDGFTCVYCQWNPSKKAGVGPYIGAKLSVHHVQPESRGGATNAENLVTCCTVCNQKLSNKTPEELCHKNVTKVCDKSVTTVQDSTEEKTKKKEEEPPLSPKGESAEEQTAVVDAPKEPPPAEVPAEPPPQFPECVRDICEEWLEYKRQRNHKYRPMGLKKLVTQVEKALAKYGQEVVRDGIEKAIANNYQGWTFCVGKPSGNGSAKPVTFGQQRQQNMAEMLQRIEAQEEAGVAGFLGGGNGQSK
jgi:5-methylcytosine-specific restriction endonuclease McrA